MLYECAAYTPYPTIYNHPMPILPYLEKVTAFVIRRAGPADELLLIRHPTSGIQLPAGTVDEGELPEAAVLREVAEETGLRLGGVERCLGFRDELPPDATHVICRKTRVYSLPDPGSFDWAEFRRGIGVRALRQAGGFIQVSYEEGDRFPDPTYLSYQITGWVPEDSLAAANRRYFFHLACPPEMTLPAETHTDHHIFRPFWASLADLPEIIAPQQAWLKYALDKALYSP